MRRADLAMYQGKREGKDRHNVFSPRMNHSFERLELEENLRRAIAREELRLHYQPQVRISTGQVVGLRGPGQVGVSGARPAGPFGVRPRGRADGRDRPVGEVGARRGLPSSAHLPRAGPSRCPPEDEGNAYLRLGEVLTKLGREDEAREAYGAGIGQAEKFGHSGMAEDLRLAQVQLGR